MSPVELVEAALARIERFDHRLNLYITVLAEESLVAARAAEQAIAKGDYRGPLHGIPLSVKDLYWTAGVKTTAGSRVLRDWIPTENAVVVDRLGAAGVILIGNWQGEHEGVRLRPGPSRLWATVNPWHPQRTASGSSGGSAAAVAVGTDFGSMGTDLRDAASVVSPIPSHLAHLQTGAEWPGETIGVVTNLVNGTVSGDAAAARESDGAGGGRCLRRDGEDGTVQHDGTAGADAALRLQAAHLSEPGVFSPGWPPPASTVLNHYSPELHLGSDGLPA